MPLMMVWPVSGSVLTCTPKHKLVQVNVLLDSLRLRGQDLEHEHGWAQRLHGDIEHAP